MMDAVICAWRVTAHSAAVWKWDFANPCVLKEKAYSGILIVESLREVLLRMQKKK